MAFCAREAPLPPIPALARFTTEKRVSMLQLVFDKAAIKQNIAAVKRRAGDAVIYAVLINDGYGAGLIELANLLRDDGIRRFAVSEVSDIRRLRKAGFTDEEILMLRSTTDPDELNELLDLNAVCTIGSYETGVALNALAEERSTVAEAHVLVDTGTGLGGFLPAEPEKLESIYKFLPNVAITGTCTQLGGGDINSQMQLFQQTLDRLHEAKLETGLAHAASSSALMQIPGVQLDAVRIGGAFLGRCKRRRGDGLKTVCHGEASLDTVRFLPKGHTVGLNKPVHLKKPTRVAVISVGTRNGFGAINEESGGLLAWIRAWKKRKNTRVTCRGQKLRLLGGIGPSETAIDVSDLKCTAGDVVSFDIDPTCARGMERVFR